jgi:hypothetical protein
MKCDERLQEITEGRRLVNIVSTDGERQPEQFEREWEEGTRAIERFSAAFADVSVEEAEAEIARIIADIRRKDEAEAEHQSA